jgi:hypothetical protein
MQLEKGTISMDPMSTIKDISTLVKKYNDLELMKQIVDLQNQVFDLQQCNLKLQKEVADLRYLNNSDQSMVLRSPFNYYYCAEDPVPFCPTCWENDHKQIHLPEARPWSGGIRRDCRVCHQAYWEKPIDYTPVRIARTRSSWML